jgi:hypothetical protein
MITSYRIFNFFIFCSLFLHLTALAAAEIESETVNYNPNPFLLTSPHDPSILTRSNGESITINYSTVEGYFLQDLASTDPSSFDYVSILVFLSFFFSFSFVIFVNNYIG